MFGCSPKCKDISARDMLAAFQEMLDAYYFDAQVIRLVNLERFNDGSARAIVRYTRGTPAIVEMTYGFHYCEHDERVIVDFV